MGIPVERFRPEIRSLPLWVGIRHAEPTAGTIAARSVVLAKSFLHNPVYGRRPQVLASAANCGFRLMSFVFHVFQAPLDVFQFAKNARQHIQNLTFRHRAPPFEEYHALTEPDSILC